MAQNDLLNTIEQAIAALKQARKTLSSTSTGPTKTTRKKTAGAAPAKRGMSEEGRLKIAEAQRKRWAAQKKAAKKAARLTKYLPSLP
jgi:SLT domain-containing protein